MICSDVWHSFDVLASTASILNLCVISMDRYWAITDPFTYPGRMTPKRAACFIALVWVCSSVISFPAIAWWRAVAPAVSGNDTITTLGPMMLNASSTAEPLSSSSLVNINSDQCVFTDDIGYLVFSSTVSFYGPLSVMVFTYYRIYRAAVAQSKSLRLGMKQVVMASSSELCGAASAHRLSSGTSTGAVGGENSTGGGGGGGEVIELTLRIHRGGRAASDSRRYAALAQNQASAAAAAAAALGNNIDVESNLCGTVELDGQPGRVPISKMNFSLSRKLAKIAKERKAAK